MTKKTRIDRRGKIRSIVKRFPPVRRLHWKKLKTYAAYNNRWQWLREFEPTITLATELEIEHLLGTYLARESSTLGAPIYIIME